MWTVLKKELREGWLFLLINILWLAGVPPLMRLCIPNKWDDDATVIFYAFMFGLFVPLYLVILAAGLVQDENTFLMRGLPVRPWKVAAGKLIYLGLCFVVLEALCLPYMVGQLAWPDWIQLDLALIHLWTAATAVAAVMSFAFACFLPRKSYSIFGSLMATILGMGALLYFASIYPSALMADRPVLVLLSAVLLLLTAGAMVLYHDLIRQGRRRWARAAAVALLLPALAGVLWMRAPHWLKQTVIGNPYRLSPAGAELFIASGPTREPYVFNVKTGDLRPFPYLGKAEHIVDTDPDRNLVYTATSKTFKREGKTLRKYSAIEITSGKTRDLGLLPARSVSFEGDIARWVEIDDKTRTFGFKDLVRGTTFEFDGAGCRHAQWGKEGVLFDSPSPEGTVWTFVDFATARPREAFRGEYHPWPWSVGMGYLLFEGSGDFRQGIPYDRDVFQWDPAKGTMQRFGPGRPLLAQDDLAVFIRGGADAPKTLALVEDGKERSTLPTPYLGGYPLGYYRHDSVMQAGSPWKFQFWSDKERLSRVLGVLSIDGDRLDLKSTPLPPSMIDLFPIPGSGDLLLFVKNEKDAPDWDDSLCQVYRLDPATGKKKRLV